jgi:hypothetical protein
MHTDFFSYTMIACSCVVVNCSVFVTCEPIPSLPASASATVTTSLSEQLKATLLATIAMVFHTTLVPVGHSHPETDKSYIYGGFV